MTERSPGNRAFFVSGFRSRRRGKAEEMREPFEIWPGPMEGVMSPELIRAASRLGLVSRWMTPFLRISTHCPKSRVLAEFFEPFRASGIPVTVQLMGVQPEPLAEAAVRFLELGAAGINLNCGCPSRQVTGGGAGGGALRNPECAAGILRAIRDRVGEMPVSVKLRTGWEDPAEQERLIPLFTAAGADRLFVHFRTVREQYLPAAGREERLRRGVELAGSVPVIVNGDIGSAEDAFRLKESTGAAGVMAARGWLRDPWLLRRIAGDGTAQPEEARRELWNRVLEQGFKVCRAIELSNLLWGTANPWFEQLKALPHAARITRL